MSGGGGAMVNDSPWREISWASNPTVREAAKQDDETTDTAPSDPPPSLSELVKGRAGNSNFGRAGLVGRGLRMHSPPRRRQWARFSAHVAGRGVASHVRGRGQPRPVAVVAGNVDVAAGVRGTGDGRADSRQRRVRRLPSGPRRRDELCCGFRRRLSGTVA